MIINGERSLAYIASVTGISEMDADKLESVDIRGWHVVCGKGEFKVGDMGVFIEMDSLCPEVPPFSDIEFLVKKRYRVRSQKIRGVYSQGLFIQLDKFGLTPEEVRDGMDMTKRLGITYVDPADSGRKGDDGKATDPIEQVRRLQEYHKWLKKMPRFTYPLIRKLYRREIRLMIWPQWVRKTDEERIQNLKYDRLKIETWTATEKLDGTSATYAMKRRKLTPADYIKACFGKPIKRYDFYVCSRNVAYNIDYDKNIYTAIAKRFDIENDMWRYIDGHFDMDWLIIQGEIFGGNIQKRDYNKSEPSFRVFNIINSEKHRMSTSMMSVVLDIYFEMEPVPIVAHTMKLPDTCDELMEMADGPSKIDGLPREGLVFRSFEGVRSFKAVSNKYIEKYQR